MKDTNTYQEDLRNYAKAVVAFLIFMSLCLLLFFYCVQKDVDKDTEKTIMDHVERQVYHFQMMINTNYEYLEGVAQHIGESEELLSEDHLDLIANICNKAGFERIAIIQPDGTSTYNDGTKNNVSNRMYFIEAMNGKRSLSDPLESKIDGTSRVILSVPITKNDDIKGVLGGSYNVGELSRMLFEDIYNGEGYSYILTKEGIIISADDEQLKEEENKKINFFAYHNGTENVNDQITKELRKDFYQQQKGCIKQLNNGNLLYLAYSPLSMEDWMLCYVVPVMEAQENFSFIKTYEIILSGAFILSVFVLILVLLRINNKRQSTLLHYARTDSLTGCSNKKSTEETIDQWLAGEECFGFQALIMLDIDKFKEINDVYGHVIGDEVLRRVGQLLKRQFRNDDIIGRIGGDEFIVLMKNVNGIEDALAKAQKLTDNFSELRVPGMEEHQITSSMGISIHPLNGFFYMDLYKCADTALYETKRNGRNGYTLYTGEESAEE